jgi:steroid Delta-isomerase
MATPDQIRAAVDSYVELFPTEQDAWLELFAADAQVEDPVGSPLRSGRDEIGAFWQESHAMADSIRLERTGPVRVAGNEAAFPMQVHPVVGGTAFVMDVIDVMSFDDDGRITSLRAFWDPAEMRPANG